MDFIESLPKCDYLERAGLRFQLSHHLPDKTYGRDLLPHARQENFDQLVDKSEVDVAVYGHCHHQLLRYSTDGQLIINPGSIGQPYFTWSNLKKDLRTQYAILELSDVGIDNVFFRKVAFDIEAELILAKERGLPYQNLYRELLETGVVHTHDEPCLRAFHSKTNCDQEVKTYFKARGFSDNLSVKL